MDKNILVLSNISKSYRQGSESISIFDNFNLTVDKGEFISITGPSGSGKTTLLNLIGLIAVSYTHLTLPTIYSV